MGPRLALMVAVGILAVFGLLMVYSASSISAMATTGSSTYFLVRQLVFVVVGGILAFGLSRIDYHNYRAALLILGYIVIMLGLTVTLVLGVTSHGATRWVEIIPGFTLQPSEFAKPLVVLVAAYILYRYYEEMDIELVTAVVAGVVGVLLPLVLILLQPDKGTAMIVAATLAVMLFLSGFSPKVLITLVIFGLLGFLALTLRDDYSLQRVITMFNPEADPYGAGYQILQGFYAFGNGGLAGVGIGLSRQKYNYLPEAHNDFIFAIIGEELGMLGTVAVCALFALLVWAGMQIARHANDLWGKLIAAGATTMIAVQFLINVGGVTGLIPLTGKPLPFLSYGGSSTLSSFILMGLVLSVSDHSTLPETVHDARRRQMSAAAPVAARKEAFVLMEGGGGAARPKRVDLGPSASERLRGSSSRPGGTSRRRR